MQRSAGILLPIASLPSPYGIGDFGKGAYRFLDFLHNAGQRVWLILPLTIPDSLGSPFASRSAFALNWMLISPEGLAEEGLLQSGHLAHCRIPTRRIPYRTVYRKKHTMLRKAYVLFQQHASNRDRAQWKTFRRQERAWLTDYCLYQSLKHQYADIPWFHWPKPLRQASTKALTQWRREHADDIAFYAFEQWIAHRQWSALQKYARRRSVTIIGNLPFFAAHDSADVWAYQRAFHLRRNGKLHLVAGAPPDPMFPDGQKWGFPLYRWSQVRHGRFRWWYARLERSLALYHRVVLDHFRGYVSVWGIVARRQDALRGRWHASPGKRVLSHFRTHHNVRRIIVEDLGSITPAVRLLQHQLGAEGMRILQTSFDEGERDYDNPQRYPVRSVALTGTHDQHTAVGWFQAATHTDRRRAMDAIGATTSASYARKLIDAGLRSRSRLFVAPLQDWLGLDDHARINVPGTKRNNWSWRLPERALTRDLATTLRKATKRAHR